MRMHGAVVRITLPWDAVCPDNRRATLHLRRGRPVVALSARYRAAKQAAAVHALAQMRSARQTPFPANCALSLTATVHAPDRRRRDLTNLAKAAHDSLASVVFADDVQLCDVRYVRGPIDRDRPRVELVITPLSTPLSTAPET